MENINLPISLDKCSICLEDLCYSNNNKENIIYTLSCGHKLHFKCYREIFYRELNIFIKCPMCREINYNINKPFNDNLSNLQIFTSHKFLNQRCKCKTKNGLRCKNKSTLFNYGMCYQHNKEILPKDKYDLMLKYIYLILSQRNNWFSKIHLFDIGKKLIIKNNLDEIEEIMFYFYKFINLNGIKSIQDYYSMYDFYELKRPQLPWVNHCYKNFTFT